MDRGGGIRILGYGWNPLLEYIQDKRALSTQSDGLSIYTGILY
jgi:hypothetical protein